MGHRYINRRTNDVVETLEPNPALDYNDDVWKREDDVDLDPATVEAHEAEAAQRAAIEQSTALREQSDPSADQPPHVPAELGPETIAELERLRAHCAEQDAALEKARVEYQELCAALEEVRRVSDGVVAERDELRAKLAEIPAPDGETAAPAETPAPAATDEPPADDASKTETPKSAPRSRAKPKTSAGAKRAAKD